MSALTADVRGYFEAPNIAHIATVLPDGAPHTVPVWVDLHGEQIAFLTSPNSRKARNLERDPRIALSVIQHDKPTAMASIRGRVVSRLEGDAAWEIIDRISQKYIGQAYPLRTDRALYLIDVDHAWAQSF
ncbi:MAG TPA: PPOX class F420-dependent oxidoreductase [Micromonosporaceae bacterium]|nr:PPOX class F420-dependent oxidoreductase [Micromonosporaceae bacterium]